MADPDETTVSYPLYIVTFVDLLGHGELLRETHVLNATQEDFDRVAGTLKLIVARMESVRAVFRGLSNELAKDRDPPEDLQGEAARHFTEFRKVEMNARYFSDSVILTTKLVDGERFGRWNVINGLWQHLYGTAALVLITLANRIAIRGGTAIGRCLDHEGEYIGYAIKEAYDLEHSTAGYPRIVVSPMVRQVLTQPLPPMQKKLAAGTERIAQNALQLLLREDEVVDTLDFLSPLVRELDLNPGIFAAAETFAREQRNRFDADEKLRPRYDRLIAHFDRARHVWTPQPGADRP